MAHKINSAGAATKATAEQGKEIVLKLGPGLGRYGSFAGVYLFIFFYSLFCDRLGRFVCRRPVLVILASIVLAGLGMGIKHMS